MVTLGTVRCAYALVTARYRGGARGVLPGAPAARFGSERAGWMRAGRTGRPRVRGVGVSRGGGRGVTDASSLLSMMFFTRSSFCCFARSSAAVFSFMNLRVVCCDKTQHKFRFRPEDPPSLSASLRSSLCV